MSKLSFEDLESQWQAFDAAVADTPSIDRPCSSAAWGLAAARTLHAGSEPEITALQDGYLAFVRQDLASWGRMWMPLESSWCLASPLIGADTPHLADVLAARLTEDRSWDSVFISGIPASGRAWAHLTVLLAQRFHLYRGPAVGRCIARLDRGPDAFLAKRSRKFRKSLRQSLRTARQEPLTVEYWSLPLPAERWLALYERVLQIEARSWKGLGAQGMDQEPMASFYRHIIRLLGTAGSMRLLFIRHDGRDIGYILGSVQFDTYRGYQFSFDHRYRHLGLGNLMQWHQIVQLCREGVGHYDLGTDMPYKRRWSEIFFETGTMVIRRNPL